jgi:hypothetical protein
MAHMKDICAKYFSKYENELAKNHESIQQMDYQQKYWIDRLLKPKMLGEARIFSLESRLKECEDRRIEEV